MVIKNTLKGVVSLVLASVLIGFFAGLAFAGSDLANPWTSQARAAQMETQMVYDAEKNSIDLSFYRQEREQGALAQIAKTQGDVIYHQQMNQVKTNLFDWAGKVAILFVGYLAALGVFLFFWSRFHQMMASKEAPGKVQIRLTQVYLRPQTRAGQISNGNGNNPQPDHTRVLLNSR